jgi:O-antigen/teichoic acid export membrane protein
MTNKLDNVIEDSARSSFFLMSGTVLSTIIMAFAAILVGRLLGPGPYGEYNLILVVPTLLGVFLDFGINTGISKFTASLRINRDNGQARNIIRYGLLFQILAGIGIFVVNFAFADAFATLINRPDSGYYIRMMSSVILLQVVYTGAYSAFIGMDKTEYNALIANIMAVTKTLSSIALVLLGFGIAGALIGYVGGYLVAGVAAAGILVFKILKPLDNGEKGSFTQTLRTLANYGIPVYIGVILVGFTPLYQQIVLAFFTSNVDIGNFRASSNFLVLLSTIPTSITAALLPAFSKLDSPSVEGLKIFFKRANKYACLLIMPIATLIIILSNVLVQVIYGPAYQTASLFLIIGCLPYFLVGLGFLTLTSMFNGLGETRTTLRMAAINFFVILALTPILANIYGVPGVIITSLISNTVAMTYGALVARTRFRIEFDAPSSLKIYLASAASAIPPLVLLKLTSLPDPIALVAGGILYLLIYLTIVPLARVIGYYELQKAAQITQKIKVLAPIAKPILKYEERILRSRASQQTQKPSQAT